MLWETDTYVYREIYINIMYICAYGSELLAPSQPFEVMFLLGFEGRIRVC